MATPARARPQTFARYELARLGRLDGTEREALVAGVVRPGSLPIGPELRRMRELRPVHRTQTSTCASEAPHRPVARYIRWLGLAACVILVIATVIRSRTTRGRRSFFSEGASSVPTEAKLDAP